MKEKRPIEQHPFEPFLPKGARMLFLGSFPPQPHRWCMPFYYPNWINDFWRIMGLIHFADKDHFCILGEKRFDETLIRKFCTDAGLAFYDTASEVRRLRDNASDAFLEVVSPTDIPALLYRIPSCKMLITTGEKATTPTPTPTPPSYTAPATHPSNSGACRPLPAPIPFRWRKKPISTVGCSSECPYDSSARREGIR